MITNYLALIRNFKCNDLSFYFTSLSSLQLEELEKCIQDDSNPLSCGERLLQLRILSLYLVGVP